MPQNILIATLGDHPAVITGMVKALRELERLEIDTLHVLYPQDTGKNIAQLGYPLIAEHLDGVCRVIPEPLPFADPNSYETSILFLQTLAGILKRYTDQRHYHIYLSLAGGRKNMSALMALVTQFFPAVKRLYHLLDRQEGKRNAAFPSIEEIVLMEPAAQRRTLDPSLEQLNLIAIPYPGAFAQSSQLWQFLGSPDMDAVAPIPLTPDAEMFYRAISQPNRTTHLLQVWLSKTAYEQYRHWAEQGSHYVHEFLTCFKQMRDPVLLKNRMHGTFGDMHFFKRRRTRERPFYYTLPHPIHLYPKKRVEQVIICGLSVEQGNGQYDLPADELLKLNDRQPYKRLSELNTRDHVLLVPLGNSPMIATQTYTLLQESDAEGRPHIPTVAVLYPERSATIGNNVGLLRKQFEHRGVEFLHYPIKDLADVDSTAASRTYLNAILETIQKLRIKYPDRQIALSLSGGRKGMAALTLFAAQQAGIERVYHTLITDNRLERKISTETTYNELVKLPTEQAKASRLFLDDYGRENFALFTIPIIPFAK